MSIKARKAARNLLAELRIAKEAPIDPKKIASDLGINVFEQPFPSELDVSAILVKEGDKTAIAVNQTESAYRKRFSVAHEIGHFVLHANNELLTVDKGIEQRLFLRSKKSNTIDEIEANQFAAELLMPENLINDDFRKLLSSGEENVVSKLSKQYRVSEAAIAYRLNDLDLQQN